MGEVGKAVVGGQNKENGEAGQNKANGATDTSKAKLKGKAAMKGVVQKEEPVEQYFLSAIRPKPRPMLLIVFVLLTACMLALYDKCSVEGKKADCGFSGVTAGQCESTQCFFKGGGGPYKLKVQVEREEGSSLGLLVNEDPAGGAVVREVTSGAIFKYNADANEEKRIMEGDRLVKIDGASSSKSIQESLSATSGKTVKFEFYRSRLPSFLHWVTNKQGKPNLLEQVLTAPGSMFFAEMWRYHAAVGAAVWFLSGYPLASLPFYFTLSAGTAWQLARCCHDMDVKPGVAHCYIGKREEVQKVAERVVARGKELAQNLLDNPRQFLDVSREYLELLALPEKA